MTSALSSLIEELLLQLTTQKASLKLSLPQPFYCFYMFAPLRQMMLYTCHGLKSVILCCQYKNTDANQSLRFLENALTKHDKLLIQLCTHTANKLSSCWRLSCYKVMNLEKKHSEVVYIYIYIYTYKIYFPGLVCKD